jgi:hypothetical protein
MTDSCMFTYSVRLEPSLVLLLTLALLFLVFPFLFPVLTLLLRRFFFLINVHALIL